MKNNYVNGKPFLEKSFNKHLELEDAVEASEPQRKALKGKLQKIL